MSHGSVVLGDLKLHLGPQLVLGGISATVGPGDRLAVVGPNGVGKTTLLRIIAGELTPDGGSSRRSPAEATVGLLPQERDASPETAPAGPESATVVDRSAKWSGPAAIGSVVRPGAATSGTFGHSRTQVPGDETLLGYLARRTGVAAAEAELHSATERLAAEDPGSDDRYALALERYLALGAADLDARAPGVLAGLGLDPERLHTRVTGLSGGQVARLALASVMLARFDVLLLDEPTNDLDMAGLEKLEEFLRARQGGLVMVSHDRTFLEKVATDVLEIDEFSRKGRLFGGGFDSYLEERERAREHAREAYDSYVEQKQALEEQARRQKEWARSGNAREKRSPRDGDKMQRDFRINRTQRGMAKAAAAERAAGRLESVEEPRTPWELRLKLDQRSRSSDRVATLSGVVVERGTFRLGPADLDLRYGDRQAVVGPNGSGKSTLLSVLLGELEPTAGERRLGRGVVIGQIDQVRRGVDPQSPLLQAFRDTGGLDETEARSLLAKFGLEADDVLRRTGSLSPGERTRADLALLMARQANLLVLDEPTNHLDLPAVEQLEQALSSFDGTLILVSHDRRLLEAVRPSHTVRLLDGQVTTEKA